MSQGQLISTGMLYKDSDYYVIRQPMPYVLRESNAYLMETGDGWAVVDVGVNLQSTRDIWTMAVREVGIPFTSIKKIYVTHCHPDHVGASAWLQQVAGELYTKIWELSPYVHLHRVTPGETLGYLNELTDRSLLNREETDRLRFSPL